MPYHNSELMNKIYSLHAKTKVKKSTEECSPHILRLADGLLANLGNVFKEAVMNELEISYPTFNRFLNNTSIGKVQTATTVQIMNALVKYINFEWKRMKLESLHSSNTELNDLDTLEGKL